ncbi:MAG: spermidine synthase [Proteobacteria bacterium]|nr:spermidine synthase [Burkholderiales bacterium]
MRIADPVHLELAYTRAMMASLLFRPELPRHALSIGLGGGSLVKFLYHRLPACRLEVVECDPEVVAMARGYFSLPEDSGRLATVVADGAEHLAQRHTAPVDLVLVDVYDGSRQVAGCATRAFFASAARTLTPEGVCAVNFWSNTSEFSAYRDRFLDAFSGRVLLLPAARPGNVIAFGLASADGDWRWACLRARAATLEHSLGLEYGAFVDGLRASNPYTENRLLM